VQELKLYYRADRDDARRKLLGPCSAPLQLEDSEQPGCIYQVASRRPVSAGIFGKSHEMD